MPAVTSRTIAMLLSSFVLLCLSFNIILTSTASPGPSLRFRRGLPDVVFLPHSTTSSALNSPRAPPPITTTEATTSTTTTTTATSPSVTSSITPVTTSSSTTTVASSASTSTASTTDTLVSTTSSTSPTSTTSSTTSPTTSTTSSSSTASIAATPFVPAFTPTTRASSRTVIVVTATATDLRANNTPTDAPNAPGSSSFLSNKGAVAGVFSIVGLVGVGLIFVAVTYFMRRRKRMNDYDDFFEKYREPPLDDNVSTLNVTTQAAMDAYPDRQIHFGSGPIPPANPNAYASTQPMDDYAEQGPSYIAHDYGYPPDTAYADPGELYNTQVAYGLPGQAVYDVDQGQAAAGHTTQGQPSAAIIQQGSNAPPSAYSDPAMRDSYQQSIDSFYGASVAR